MYSSDGVKEAWRIVGEIAWVRYSGVPKYMKAEHDGIQNSTKQCVEPFQLDLVKTI